LHGAAAGPPIGLTVTVAVSAVATDGIEEMTRVLPDTVKHPGAAAPGQGSRTVGVPAFCWAVVPISIAVAPVMLVPEIVTVFPPAIVLVAGLSVTPDGAVGSVPAVVLVAMPGLPSEEDAVTVVPDWTVLAVTLELVTMPSTVMVGSEAPAANGVALSVQVTVCPDGDPQVQPDP
jgi:hypothetical protein